MFFVWREIERMLMKEGGVVLFCFVNCLLLVGFMMVSWKEEEREYFAFC